jgi:Xaa-Pro aminopeptidase
VTLHPALVGLPPLVLTGRDAGLRSNFAGIDALLVSDLTNIRWLTGFTGSNGAVVVLPDRLVLVTDGRYGEQAERQLAEAGVEGEVLVAPSGTPLSGRLAEALGSTGRIGFESAHVSHQQWEQYTEALPGDLVPTVGLVERGRRVKDPAEIARMEAACRIADQALLEVAPTIVPGRTEAGIRNDLERRMRELGASGPSYDTIVAAGPINAPLPHHRPTATPVEEGHTVIIDVGALVDGYHSDMTRTFVVGEPTPLQLEVYEVVLTAQRAGVDAVAPGVTAREIDAVCRGIITEAGFGPWFLHGTGHGVGLLIHEDPFLNANATWELQVGDVVTVEPGVYRGDLGGVRVEDLVEVTSTGGRTLTTSPKDAPCLPSARTI